FFRYYKCMHSGVTLVNKSYITTAVGNGAIINHRDTLGGDQLTKRPENTLEPLRLKSPSRPCPTASCNKTPGQPGPKTTGITPAGAGRDSRFSSACRTA